MMTQIPKYHANCHSKKIGPITLKIDTTYNQNIVLF